MNHSLCVVIYFFQGVSLVRFSFNSAKGNGRGEEGHFGPTQGWFACLGRLSVVNDLSWNREERNPFQH